MGPSGGGKTTLCNLIPRFYDVTSGRILIDGQDIRHVTLESLRGAIGVVQAGRLSVQRHGGPENIAYGKPGATRAEIEQAAALAGADAFVRALEGRLRHLRGRTGRQAVRRARNSAFPSRGCF